MTHSEALSRFFYCSMKKLKVEKPTSENFIVSLRFNSVNKWKRLLIRA